MAHLPFGNGGGRFRIVYTISSRALPLGKMPELWSDDRYDPTSGSQKADVAS